MQVFLKKFKRVIVSSLILMMMIVVGLATFELGWVLIKDIITPRSSSSKSANCSKFSFLIKIQPTP